MMIYPAVKYWTKFALILALLGSMWGLSGCKSGGASLDASLADLNKPITIDVWKFTLTGLPISTNVVGGNGVSHSAENGIYIIIPADVTNTSTDIALFPTDLVFIKDSTGKEWALSDSTPVFAYKETNPKTDLLVDSPLAGGETRHTVLMFDVDVTATGFMMIFHGHPDTLRLGYPTK
jgi:hypothetical protein